MGPLIAGHVALDDGRNLACEISNFSRSTLELRTPNILPQHHRVTVHLLGLSIDGVITALAANDPCVSTLEFELTPELRVLVASRLRLHDRGDVPGDDANEILEHESSELTSSLPIDIRRALTSTLPLPSGRTTRGGKIETTKTEDAAARLELPLDTFATTARAIEETRHMRAGRATEPTTAPGGSREITLPELAEPMPRASGVGSEDLDRTDATHPTNKTLESDVEDTLTNRTSHRVAVGDARTSEFENILAALTPDDDDDDPSTIHTVGEGTPSR